MDRIATGLTDRTWIMPITLESSDQRPQFAVQSHWSIVQLLEKVPAGDLRSTHV
jgi:hypothetical protein